MLNDPTVTQPTLLLIFGLGTLAVLVVTTTGYFFFRRWKSQDEHLGKNFRDTHRSR
jgi:hypothetical protein